MNLLPLNSLDDPATPFTVHAAANRDVTQLVLLHLEEPDRIVCAWHEHYFGASGSESTKKIWTGIVKAVDTGADTDESLQYEVTPSRVEDLNGAQGRPALAPLADGGYLVAWEHRDENEATSRVRWTRFGQSGAKISTAAYLTSSNPGSQAIPGMGVSSQAEVFLLWLADQGGEAADFVGRLGTVPAEVGTAEIGAILFSETVVGTGAVGAESFPVVKGMYDGRFAMVWQSDASQIVLRFARLQGAETP